MNFLLAKFSKFETLFNSIKKSYLFLGFMTGLLVIQFVPPAPPFSPDLGRASYWQSYETSYFATLRSYENVIAKAIDAKEIPLIIFGDSTIRGTGANGSEVWTRVLETKLQQSNPRIKVINFAQNAGDIMGPFLYHHLQQKFPEAYYIVQWHFSSEVGVRHPFHYWLTSEIALRDGGKNPAVKRSFAVVPVWKEELSTNFRIGPSTEQFAFVMAGLNVATNYLDVGNWFRYLLLGYPTITAKRTPIILPLRNAKDMDVPRRSFIPPDDNQVNEMKKIFLGQEKARQIYLEEPFEKHQRYFLEMFPAAQRANLFLLTLDFNPFYAPFNDTSKNSQWASNRRELGREMERMPDLRWISLSASQGDFEVNDYIDLGHLTPSGQFKLASAVSNFVLNPPFWLERETG